MGGGVVDDEKSSLAKDSLDGGPPRRILLALGIEKNKIKA